MMKPRSTFSPQVDEARWSETQRLYQAWLALPDDEREPRTENDVAARLGVDRKTLYNWRKLPGFLDAAHTEAYMRLRTALPAVFRNIARRAAEGDRREWVDLYLSLMGGAQAVAGANATMNMTNQMTEDEAMTLLEQGIGLRLTAHVADGGEGQT